MGAPQGQGRKGLGEVTHDLRSALAASSAYLDLARERLAEGQPLEDEDLARVERGLQKVAAALAELEALAPRAPREGSR